MLPHAEVLRVDGDLLYSASVTRRGWGLEERDVEGAFRWALGSEAEVEFHSLTRPTKLSARARGAVPPGRSTQGVVALLNGVEIGSLELGAEWAELELPLSPPELRRGANRLTLRFASPLAPGKEALERRPLAACFRSLEVGRRRPLPAGRRPLRIELGSAEIADRLELGWSEPRPGGPDGAGWRGASAPRAEMRLNLSAPADRRLLLTVRRPDGLDSQRMEVWLNGRQLAAHELVADWSTVVAEAPREEWRPNGNRLLLAFESVRAVGDAHPGAEVARIEVETLGEPALAESFDELGAYVEQPAKSSLDLFRWLSERSPRLALEAGWRSGSSVRIVVDLEPDGGEPVEVWRGELHGGEPRSVDLSPWAGRLARLRLSAPGADVIWRRIELLGHGEEPPTSLYEAREPAPVVAEPRPNLLLYVVDALRADRTSLYGYHRRTTPRLEELARSSILFDPAWANASWTRPATATLLTGTLPSVHGATNTLSALVNTSELLSETLQAAGYATYALVANPYLHGPWSFDRGWHEYRYVDTAPTFADSSAALNREAILRLAELATDERPFFLYLHSMDVHAPYRPPEGYRGFVDPEYQGPMDGSTRSVKELLQALRRDGAEAHREDLARLGGLYDGGVLHNDARIGELLDAMEELGLLETTAVLVTSDHGEELFEHGGAMHGHTLYQEQIAIPMLLRPPGGVEPRRVAGAQQLDVAVMLAALAGVTPSQAIGRRLYAESGETRRPLFAEVEMADRRVWSFVEGDMKLHYNRNPVHAEWQGRETHGLFDLRADPGETVNLYRTRPVLAGYLLQRARETAGRLPGGTYQNAVEPWRLTEELRGRLRALGYLQ